MTEAMVAPRERPAPTTIFRNQRTLMVRNLRPGLTECGKIKIGVKGDMRTSKGGKDFQPPQKLDHFVITTLTRGPDNNFLRDEEIHGRLGEKPTDIPIRLLFNDPFLNFQTVYAAFKGSQRFCTGDGEEAERLQDNGTVKHIGCPCQLLDPGYQGADKCKINGTLSVVIDGAAVVGGVWKLRTTSINTCQGIASSLTLLSGLTGGQIAGIPLMLTLRPKAAVTPGGQSTTVYVVGLEYRGTIEELRQLALERATADAAFGERMNRVEEQARLMLAAPSVGSDDMEHVEEFYPKAAARAHSATLIEDVSEQSPADSYDPKTGEVLKPDFVLRRPAKPTTAAPEQAKRRGPPPEFWERENLTIPVTPPAKGGWQKWQGLVSDTIDTAPDTSALERLIADNAAGLDALERENSRAAIALRDKAADVGLLLEDAAKPILGEDEDGRSSSA
jgi:hypothetical protein